MSKLLITGIPGTGKTTIGNYLAEHYEFNHHDFEEHFNNPTGLEKFIQNSSLNKVITWGFVPGGHDTVINSIQDLGYIMIWFDGNRVAARKAFMARGTVPEILLDLQMERIVKMDLQKFNPIQFNTFDCDGNFLNVDFICTEIFKLIADK